MNVDFEVVQGSGTGTIAHSFAFDVIDDDLIAGPDFLYQHKLPSKHRYICNKSTFMETVPAAARPQKAKKIPAYLIYEEMDGQPIYRKGYKSVLNKSKTLEDIMGSSTLQGEVHVYVFSLLLQHFGLEKFTIHCNEAGLHPGKRILKLYQASA